MSRFGELPLWVALVVAFLLVLGSAITLLGAIGLVRFETFYQRVHAPTLGTTWGAGDSPHGTSIFCSLVPTRPLLHEYLSSVLVTGTTPVSLMLLARAAFCRDRAESGNPPPGMPKL